MIIISLHSNNDLSLFLALPKPYLDFGNDPSCITAEQHYITYSHTEQNTSEGHYEISPKDVSFVRNQGCLDVSGQNDSFPIDRSPRCSWRRNPRAVAQLLTGQATSKGAREGKQRKDYQQASISNGIRIIIESRSLGKLVRFA